MGLWKRIVPAVLLAASVGNADVITDWNNVYLDTIRAVGGGPCPLARSGAMMHVAMYDAVNSVDKTHQPYLSIISTPSYTSREAASAQAARDVLVNLYPSRTAIYDAALTSSLSVIANGPAKTAGISLGHTCANACISNRANDGTNNLPTYILGGNPGDWKPTYPDYTSTPHAFGWGLTVPWTMQSSTAFRPQGPLGFTNMTALLASPGYAAQVNEVKSIGSLNSTTRTPYQTLTAFFWANDVNGTYKPPGHLNYITQVVSSQFGLTLSENARLFALANLAMADAAIVAWDAKYDTNIDLWRPISAIREADTDGNPLTIADTGWEALNPFSPTFPAYTSGHATFSAAHAAVMGNFFADRTTFTINSEDPYYNALPNHGPRTYQRFSDAAWENAESRLYLGVHYRFDAVEGNSSGTNLGNYVSDTMLRPFHRADLNGDHRLNILDFVTFMNYYSTSNWRTDFNHDGYKNVADFLAFINCYVSDCR